MLDPTFKFSQHNLSDFIECPRRFYLRYVEKQPWPMVTASPTGLSPLEYQGYLWRGLVLHRWIERYWLGITPAPSPNGKQPHDELSLWWSRFANTNFDDLPAQRLPELALVAPIGDRLLYARFDLLAMDTPLSLPLPRGEVQARAIIVDWKTMRGPRAPGYRFLSARAQTRIYLYVLATAGAAFNGSVMLKPEQCRMCYWLANFPEQPWVEIGYSQSQYEEDQRWLLNLVEDVSRREGEDQFPPHKKAGVLTVLTRRYANAAVAHPGMSGSTPTQSWNSISDQASICRGTISARSIPPSHNALLALRRVPRTPSCRVRKKVGLLYCGLRRC